MYRCKFVYRYVHIYFFRDSYIGILGNMCINFTHEIESRNFNTFISSLMSIFNLVFFKLITYELYFIYSYFCIMSYLIKKKEPCFYFSFRTISDAVITKLLLLYCTFLNRINNNFTFHLIEWKMYFVLRKLVQYWNPEFPTNYVYIWNIEPLKNAPQERRLHTHQVTRARSITCISEHHSMFLFTTKLNHLLENVTNTTSLQASWGIYLKSEIATRQFSNAYRAHHNWNEFVK